MTSPSYPAALDALANPGPTTETDDAGYELDIVVARLQNCIMAIETKLGIGVGGPSATGVLHALTPGSSGWGLISTAEIAANAVSQAGISVGVTSPQCSSAGYIDLVTSGATPQQVTLTCAAGSDLEVWFAGMFSVPSVNNFNLAFSLDGAAESFAMTLTEPVGTALIPVVLLGFYPSVPPGPHTIKMRWQSPTTVTVTANAAQRVLLVRERRR